MIKPNQLRDKSLKELYSLKKSIEYEKVKASSLWGKGKVDNKKAGISKVVSKKGEKTSIQRDLRRLYARILTIIKEKEDENS